MSCPDCFKGHTHEGTPGGSIVELHGLQTYVAEPAQGREVKGIIVVIPDAFGWDFVNNRLLADHYAQKSNYRVYLPDFMLGTLPNSVLTLGPRLTRAAQVDPRLLGCWTAFASSRPKKAAT